jgi:Tripartite tricarboxylate transporter TctB family
MKIRSQRDFWSGLMFIVCGGAFAAGALSYSFGSSARPGPGYFPFGLGVLMAVLGAVVLFKALTVETEDGEPVGAFAWKPLLIILASILFFGWALPKLGMLIALPLLVLTSSMAGDEFKLKEALMNCVILTLLSWVVFSKGLGLTIPLYPTLFAATGA